MASNSGSITNTAPDLLRGTVDLLILRTLANGPLHGYAIAQRLRVASQDILQVGESSLYPSLQRLLARGWVKAAWGVSDNNRKAKFYKLTKAGRKQIERDTRQWEETAAIIMRFLAGEE